MRCLSCQQETPANQLKAFNKLLLCPPCHAMATKAETEIEREISRARQLTHNWLELHILQGGLLRGGSGVEEADVGYGSRVRNVLRAAQVPGMRGKEENALPSDGSSVGGSTGPEAR